jgi:hypothetical protein
MASALLIGETKQGACSNMFITRTALTRIASVLTVLVVAACSTGSKDDDSETSSAASGSGCAEEEEANDKIYCAADADCDSDEVCTEGMCTGLDGEEEDDEAECSDDDDDEEEADEADETDDVDEADDADEEEVDDKITCTVDTDCDADEVCTSGLCT